MHLKNTFLLKHLLMGMELLAQAAILFDEFLLLLQQVHHRKLHLYQVINHLGLAKRSNTLRGRLEQ